MRSAVPGTCTSASQLAGAQLTAAKPPTILSRPTNATPAPATSRKGTVMVTNPEFGKMMFSIAPPQQCNESPIRSSNGAKCERNNANSDAASFDKKAFFSWDSVNTNLELHTSATAAHHAGSVSSCYKSTDRAVGSAKQRDNLHARTRRHGLARRVTQLPPSNSQIQIPKYRC